MMFALFLFALVDLGLILKDKKKEAVIVFALALLYLLILFVYHSDHPFEVLL